MPSHPRARRTTRHLTRALALTAASVTAVVLAAPPGTAFAPPAERAVAAVPAPPSGFTTVFSDDFSGPAGTPLDSATWRYDLGHGYPGGATNWGTGEIEEMTSSTANVAQDGAGHLAITPLRDASGHWTSGRVETQRTDLAAPAGGVLRVEARIQQPDVTTANGAGYWPAFWMLGQAARANGAAGWPSIGEIDVLEDINGRSSLFQTLHCGTNPGGPCNETTGIGSGEMACSGCQTGFHTYAVEYDRSTSPEQLRFYRDGSQTFAVSADRVDPTTWANALHHGFFVILNVAMGGGFPDAFGGGPYASTVSGRPMLVDYVTAATRGGSSTPTPTPTPTPTSTPTPTPTPTQTGGSRDAYATIDATSYDQQSGTQTEPSSEGGRDVGWIANGDWLLYRGVRFGSTPAHQFQLRSASGAAAGVSGLVQVRLDSRSNPPVGTIAVGPTGGWQSWRTVPGDAGSVTGTHDVYLTFASGQPADFVNVRWLTFAH